MEIEIQDTINLNIQSEPLPMVDTILTVEESPTVVSYAISQSEPCNAIDDHELSVVSMGIEYLLILLIIVLTVNIWANYKAILLKIKKMSNSHYLTKRFLQNDSLAVNHYFSRLKILITICLSFYVLRVVPVLDMPIFIDFKEMIFALTAIFLTVNFWLVQLFFKIHRVAFKNLTKGINMLERMFYVHLTYYCLATLIAILLTFCCSNGDLYISKIFLISSYSLILLCSIVSACVFFYSEKVLFLRFILYFCIVNSINVLFIGYLFLRLLNIEIV